MVLSVQPTVYCRASIYRPLGWDDAGTKDPHWLANGAFCVQKICVVDVMTQAVK